MQVYYGYPPMPYEVVSEVDYSDSTDIQLVKAAKRFKAEAVIITDAFVTNKTTTTVYQSGTQSLVTLNAVKKTVRYNARAASFVNFVSADRARLNELNYFLSEARKSTNGVEIFYYRRGLVSYSAKNTAQLVVKCEKEIAELELKLSGARETP